MNSEVYCMYNASAVIVVDHIKYYYLAMDFPSPIFSQILLKPSY